VPNPPTAVIIIPTFNEANSIGALLAELIRDVLPRTKWNCQILVVDARSPDGTADIVRKACEKSRGIHLLVEEKKEGLGAAYAKGFHHAMEVLHADAVVEFDGDLQHPPSAIPQLLAELDAGADLVLGSRRRPGGSYPKHWSLIRRFFSTVGGFLSRLVLFFPFRSFWAVTDPTTGLKATRVDERFRALDFGSFISLGFAYKLEMLFRLVNSGARVREIPLQFRLRETGESKLERQAPWEILWTCVLLRARHEGTRRFARFAAVGFTGFIVNSLLLEAFSRAQFIRELAGSLAFLGGSPLAFLSQSSGLASVLSVEGSILSNFALNNFWTFRQMRPRTVGSTAKKLLGFNLTSAGAIVIQSVAVGTATRFFGDTTLVRQVALVLTIGALVLPYNWLMYNRLIWRGRKS
jgi:dolichol-phosphate mannosyltransferase